VTTSRAEQRGWYFYDWANSAFYTTVVTVLYGPYLTAIARSSAGDSGDVSVLGARLPAGSVWPYLISISVVSQVLVLPIVGALADYGRRKREMLGAFAFIGSAATVLMYFVGGQAWLVGCGLFLIANLAYGSSIVVYNSFLPEIAAPEERDAVSSKGWALGFLGGGILLALNLLLYSRAASFGLTEGQAVRISLASAGIWWALFTIIPLRAIRNRGDARALPPGETYASVAVRQFAGTVREMRRYRQTLVFLIAYLAYNDGVQSVITLASQFGSEELKLPVSVLTGAILLAQFVAFFGAVMFGWIAGRIGAKRAVMLSLAIWSATLIYVFVALRTEGQFYAMAAAVGIVLGGTQALSRSIYSLLIPKGREAEYFSIYEISDKGSSMLGPLVFGMAVHATGSSRFAVLSLIVFFLAGMAVLSRVDVARGTREAARG
jgi:UMF1 family MFS transporter